MPGMKPSCDSFGRSSSVWLFVSGRSSVDDTPVNMKNAKILRLEATSQCIAREPEWRKSLYMPDILYSGEADLRNDGAELSRRSRDAMSCRAVSGGEYLTGDDKRRRVWLKILEEVR